MDTSKSPEPPPAAEASAIIFSGRPDPIWSLPVELADQIVRLWTSSTPLPECADAPSGLGYRGFRVRVAGDEWIVCDGAITRYRGGVPIESREDADYQAERLLLASSPPDSIPPELIDPRLQSSGRDK